MNPDKAGKFRTLIEQRLSELAAAEPSKRGEARPVELDQSRVGRLSRQDALQSQALSVAALERNRAHINRLRTALKRIDSDDFGWCRECGREIPEGRLEIDPAADYCVACAQRLERS
ncbi:MAG: TraR/DksA family transcriptional regulator [Gammaproteobacteria bacterium]|nr:TraR/DksA family transcriptional regulator [Gammaproteobacteria bacterium]